MSLTCMGLKNGLYIYMMRQYFKGIPTSLEEAAYVDGCGTFHTFVKIMLPDAMPTIASCFLFSFVWQWTDIFYTRLFLPSTAMSIYSNPADLHGEPGHERQQGIRREAKKTRNVQAISCGRG